MQLVEQGKLDLSKDVNEYLRDFQVPPAFGGQPIRLIDLLSHTSGFEDSYLGIASRSAEDVPELGDYLARHMPKRIYAPGRVAAYSNYDAALAGYIVSQVSGLSYEEYIEQHILQPLQMTASTVREPVPSALASKLSSSYTYAADGYEEEPFAFDNMRPDGSISASAKDMANFMIAHLNDGRYGGAELLKPATVQRMHTQSFTLNPAVAGWAHGFKEQNYNGHRVLMHDGGWESYVSVVMLVPGQKLGVFISFNGDYGNEAFQELMPKFNDTFLAASTADSPRAPTPASNADDYEEAKQYAGFYRSTRQPVTTFEKILSIATPRVSANADGSIRFQNSTWVKIEPGVYQKVDATERLAFKRDGSDTYLSTDRSSFVKVHTIDTLPATALLIGTFLIGTLWVLLGWGIAWVYRKIRRRPQPARPREVALMRKMLAAAAITGTALLAGLVVSIVQGTSIIYGVPFSVHLLLFAALLYCLLTAALVIYLIRTVASKKTPVRTRLYYALLTLAPIGFSAFLANWHLLPF